ncbi:MAG TPA: hypothetical protein VG733_18585, partial [Chthoniobacteraceae bacterium]|nr:hypothetical protein [Chthoniobacteraceae bacterium]
LPVFTSVKVKGNQTKALSNAKQIALALRLYASDNSGNFPAYTLQNGSPTTTTVSTANDAFAELFPTYLTDESIFATPGSAWSPTGPDQQYDNAPDNTSGKTLEAGENTWAYVTGLNDSSNAAVPLIADGFTGNAGVTSSHTYTVDPTQKGGVWKGKQAIVVHSDASGGIQNVSQTQYYIVGPCGNGVSNGDIFTTANGADGWLGSGNVTLNPK